MPELVQNVCFACRKVFKKPEIPYVDECPERKRKFYKCPECGDLMRYRGTNFRAPSRKDIKAWDLIRESKNL